MDDGALRKMAVDDDDFVELRSRRGTFPTGSTFLREKTGGERYPNRRKRMDPLTYLSSSQNATHCK